MATGITDLCRQAFEAGSVTPDQMFGNLRSQGIQFKEPSVRSIVSELRKDAGLQTKRGRPRTISTQIEELFNNGFVSVASVLLYLQSNCIKHNPRTVRTLVQALRKRSNITGKNHEH